jgi:hypothetical protein
MAFGMSMKHSIVFLDRGTLGAELRAPGFPHSYQEYAATPAQLVAERLRDATIAIINKVPMPAETLAQLPKLRRSLSPRLELISSTRTIAELKASPSSTFATTPSTRCLNMCSH